MAWIPGGGAGRHTVTAFEVGPHEHMRLRATATVELGTLKRKFNRIVLKSRCTLAGQPYVDAGWLPLASLKPHSPGRTVAIEELPFLSNTWDGAIVEGDCDVWLSLRERVQRTGPYEETLLGSRCHRDGVWVEEGCASLPSPGDPKPLQAASIGLNVHAFDFRTSRKGRHRVRFTVEYGVKHAVHPDWDLEAESTCSAGSETVTYVDGINGPGLFELRPGELARGFLPSSGSVKKTLSVPAERCEVKVRVENSRRDETRDIATFCLEPGTDARAGACTSG
ncbi:MAG: hypothetical protein KUG77_02570 [Nannocystaceae bacterium]|nr:hypothetical protein [Nannocystaceae bacterium]